MSDAAIKWKRVRTPDGTEHHMFVGDRLRAVVLKEDEECWTVRDVVKDNEESGYPTMGDAKVSAECIVESELD
jgi:hypothetical protein